MLAEGPHLHSRDLAIDFHETNNFRELNFGWQFQRNGNQEWKATFTKIRNVILKFHKQYSPMEPFVPSRKSVAAESFHSKCGILFKVTSESLGVTKEVEVRSGPVVEVILMVCC